MHVAAGDAEGDVVAADGLFVGAFEQAVDLAFGVVVQLELPDAELVGPLLRVPSAIKRQCA